jgi:hypothetical protein
MLKGEYHCTVDLLFDWFEISCMATDNCCFYLQNRLIQTSQAGGQWYSDTFPLSIPCLRGHIASCGTTVWCKRTILMYCLLCNFKFLFVKLREHLKIVENRVRSPN